MQARVDEEYFKINMEGHQMRLKLENTLKNCYQVQENALLLLISVPLYREWLFVSDRSRFIVLRTSYVNSNCNFFHAVFSETCLQCLYKDLMCCTEKISQRCFLFQILQELEKQRIEVLCNILNRHNLHMSSFGQALIHVRHPDLKHINPCDGYYDLYIHFCCFQGQKQIEQAVQRVDMDKDIQTLVEENSITAEDHVTEFLMTDYFVSLQITLL